MVSTRRTLAGIAQHLEESMGRREELPTVHLGPVPRPKDRGRRPVRGYGAVNVDHVVPDPEQPRAEFSQETIERLAASIRDKGQLAPIRVRWSEEHGKWIIIAGERRWRAAQQAGLPTIECYFHEEELSRGEILEQQLIENLLREDLKPVEEAKAFVSLMELNGWTGKQVAEALRVPASKVSRALALLRLPGEVQQAVDEGQIAARAAYELSKVTDERFRSELARQASAKRLTVEQSANAARNRVGKRRRPTRGTKLTFLAENRWKVVVSAPSRGTYHEVEAALQQVLDEVRHRIDNNVQIF